MDSLPYDPLAIPCVFGSDHLGHISSRAGSPGSRHMDGTYRRTNGKEHLVVVNMTVYCSHEAECGTCIR